MVHGHKRHPATAAAAAEADVSDAVRSAQRLQRRPSTARMLRHSLRLDWRASTQSVLCHRPWQKGRLAHAARVLRPRRRLDAAAAAFERLHASPGREAAHTLRTHRAVGRPRPQLLLHPAPRRATHGTLRRRITVDQVVSGHLGRRLLPVRLDLPAAALVLRVRQALACPSGALLVYRQTARKRLASPVAARRTRRRAGRRASVRAEIAAAAGQSISASCMLGVPYWLRVAVPCWLRVPSVVSTVVVGTVVVTRLSPVMDVAQRRCRQRLSVANQRHRTRRSS
mmetsp:Transcript_27859/g.65028  ORF Transcript_27859/g.65028 Transcript_27859/m.65028 type:complete len:283 (+) Transcript_27859:514-1362(+)